MKRVTWTEGLPSDVYMRLCECRNVRSDVKVLVDAKWAWMVKNGKKELGFTKGDALADILDLLDSNSQWVDLTRDEYDELISEGVA